MNHILRSIAHKGTTPIGSGCSKPCVSSWAGLRASGPRLVIVEDLHWADASSLDLLRYVAQALAAERLLVVGTFRTAGLNRLHPFQSNLGELVRLAHVMRLELASTHRG